MRKNARKKLNRSFWAIILGTWGMWEIDAQEEYAEAVEKSINW